MKLIWDAIGSEFGGRHDLYERNNGGNQEAIRTEIVVAQDAMGLTRRIGTWRNSASGSTTSMAKPFRILSILTTSI